MSENMKKVVAVMGQVFEVDISDKACGKFDTKDVKFKHGDRIEHPFVGKGTVAGVALSTDCRQKVLWCAFDNYEGKVVYPNPEDLSPASA